MKLEVFTELETVHDIWSALETRGYGYCFQRYDWAEAWIKSVGSSVGVKTRVLAFYNEAGLPSMLLPLAVRRVGGANALIPLGGGHADYTGAVFVDNMQAVSPSACWREILSWAEHDSVDLIYLDRIPKTIGDSPNPLVYPDMAPCHPTGQIILSGDWKQYYAQRMKSRLRADIRRQRKRLAEIGPVSFEVATSSMSAQSLLQAMIEQKRQRYREMGISDAFCQPGVTDFYRRLTEIGLPFGMIHLSGLKVGDTIIATHWGALDRDRYYYLMPAHLGGAWARYSPGKVLLESLIEWAYQAGLRVFDFTVGAEGYKSEWCDAAMPLYRVRQALTWKGKALLSGVLLRERIKAFPTYAKIIRGWHKVNRPC